MKPKNYLAIARNFLPEGYVIVPIEPTEEMWNAGYYASHTCCDSDIPDIYKAMINEAQK